MVGQIPVEEETTYCEVHPDRETSLRCNKCGRLMCVQCAVQTPVGYRCRECVRQQEDKYYNVAQADYVIVFAICFALSLIGGTLATAIRLGIFVIFVAFPLGGLIGNLALRATGRRRGRYSAQVAAAGAVLGGLLGPSAYIFLNTGALVFVPQFVIQNIGLLLFVGITAFAVYGMFKMRI